MLILFLLKGAKASLYRDCDDFSYDFDSDCTGEDTETVMGEIGSIWAWLIVSIIFFIGFLISMIRDVVPRPPRGDVAERYPTGESKSIFVFVMVRNIQEEYLITGWFLSKPKPRFSFKGRWCLIFVIIYTELLMVGVFYNTDSRDSIDFDEYDSIDYAYAIFSVCIAFAVYLITYVLLVHKENESWLSKTWRTGLGYFFVAVIVTLCSVFIIVVTYDFDSDNDKNYEDMVSFWMFGFFIALMLECVLAENIRLIARVIIICRAQNTTKLQPPVEDAIELSVRESRYRVSDESRYKESEDSRYRDRDESYDIYGSSVSGHRRQFSFSERE